MIKVLHICETAIGGVATYLQNLHEYCSDGICNQFVVPQNHASALSSDMDIVAYPSQKRGLQTIWNMLMTSRRALREYAPDIIFFHSTFSLGALVGLRALGWRGKAIYCAHGWAVSRFPNPHALKARIVRFVEGNTIRLCNSCVCISKYDTTLAQESGYKGDHICIENAVAASQADATLAPAEGTDISLLFVGRFDKQKGLDILLDAFHEVEAERSNLKLSIVGDAVRQDSTIQTVSNSVDFLGWKTAVELDAIYATSDALVVPSRWEGFGLVVPEAFRNGTPVLVSDQGALPSFVENGTTGYVFELDKAALQKLLSTLRKADLAAMRVPARAAFQKRYSIERWSADIHALYNRLLNV